MEEYASSVADGGWDEVARSVADSERLLDALLAGDADAVAAGVERPTRPPPASLPTTTRTPWPVRCVWRSSLPSAAIGSCAKHRRVRGMPTSSLRLLPRDLIFRAWSSSSSGAYRPRRLSSRSGSVGIIGRLRVRRAPARSCLPVFPMILNPQRHACKIERCRVRA